MIQIRCKHRVYYWDMLLIGFVATAICIVNGVTTLGKIAKKQAEKVLDF